MNDFTNFIGTVGFPIAIACALAYVIYVLAKLMLEKILVAFDTITHTNEELVKTNSILASKIENKIDIVIEKLDQKEVM